MSHRPLLPTILTLGVILALTACASAGAGAVAAEGVPTVGDDAFQAKVLESERPVVVDFSAEWCGPCKLQAPIVAKLAKAHGESVQTYMVDVDDAPKTAKRFEIRAIPTLLVFKDGKVVEKGVGLHDEAKLRKLYQTVAP